MVIGLGSGRRAVPWRPIPSGRAVVTGHWTRIDLLTVHVLLPVCLSDRDRDALSDLHENSLGPVPELDPGSSPTKPINFTASRRAFASTEEARHGTLTTGIGAAAFGGRSPCFGVDSDRPTSIVVGGSRCRNVFGLQFFFGSASVGAATRPPRRRPVRSVCTTQVAAGSVRVRRRPWRATSRTRRWRNAC